jgi:hypothetical protein
MQRQGGRSVINSGAAPVDTIAADLVIVVTDSGDFAVLGFWSSQYKFNMLVEHHQVVRIVTALQQRLVDGNLSVHHRQQLQQQIAQLRMKYPDCF